ncbi:MAG: hypothetical protein ISS47_05670 [Candidatus Omnitrophica bacterium]|nr:hypothetical protein [Candidatus Omnitrophota bacterium]
MFINLITRINISLGSFKVSLGNPLFWAGVIIIVALLLRWWGIKKLISFSIITSVLLFLMFKLDSIITDSLGKDEGNPFALLTKPFFLALTAFVFIYYSFLRKD